MLTAELQLSTVVVRRRSAQGYTKDVEFTRRLFFAHRSVGYAIVCSKSAILPTLFLNRVLPGVVTSQGDSSQMLVACSATVQTDL